MDPKDERELAEGRDYTVSYGKISKGKVTVTVTGIGNYTGTITATYIVGSDGDSPGDKKYTITYDLNGGELDGVGGIVSEQYIEGTTITLSPLSGKRILTQSLLTTAAMRKAETVTRGTEPSTRGPVMRPISSPGWSSSLRRLSGY